jgi:hypothetical protein
MRTRYLIVTSIVLSFTVMITSCGGGGGGNGRGGEACSVPTLGLTKEQAIEDIMDQTVQRGLSPKEASIGVDAVERLILLGVSVDSAYQLIIACFDHDIRAKEIAPIVRALELAIPTTGPDVTDIAITAITSGYSSEDVKDIIVAVEKGTKAGAGSEIPEEIVCMGVERNLGSYVITEIIDGFIEDINNGLSPEKARNNAIEKINSNS